MTAVPCSRWLVIDTATPVACVAVIDPAGCVAASLLLTETRRHAERLIETVDAVLAEAACALSDLAGIAVGRGPGSFIGVRTGIATAKGLALGAGVPLVGLPTLVAMAAGPGLPDGDGYALLDAKRGEIYVQPVRRTAGAAHATGPAEAMSPAAYAALVAAARFTVGSGDGIAARTHSARLGPTAEGLAAVLALLLHEGPVDATAWLVPDYARAPDAKLPAQNPNFRTRMPEPPAGSSNA